MKRKTIRGHAYRWWWTEGRGGGVSFAADGPYPSHTLPDLWAEFEGRRVRVTITDEGPVRPAPGGAPDAGAGPG